MQEVKFRFYVDYIDDILIQNYYTYVLSIYLCVENCKMSTCDELSLFQKDFSHIAF